MEETQTSLSISDLVQGIVARGVDPNSEKALALFDFKNAATPPVKTKVALYEFLAMAGLHNESKLFGVLFEQFGSTLKLK